MPFLDLGGNSDYDSAPAYTQEQIKQSIQNAKIHFGAQHNIGKILETLPIHYSYRGQAQNQRDREGIGFNGAGL